MRARKRSEQEKITADWARLGAMFNTAPAVRTPDLEMLLLRTARQAKENSRLVILAATWLLCYGEYVAKRRLAVMVRAELGAEELPVMGLMLGWVGERGPRHGRRFAEVMAACAPARVPGPLTTVCRGNAVLRALAEKQASENSRRWGVWMDAFEPKYEAIRPAEWVARHNRSLAIRAICGGDLVATIAADARAGSADFGSESALARRYGASRAAVREALRKLKLAGFAEQYSRGRSRAIAVRVGSMG